MPQFETHIVMAGPGPAIHDFEPHRRCTEVVDARTGLPPDLIRETKLDEIGPDSKPRRYRIAVKPGCGPLWEVGRPVARLRAMAFTRDGRWLRSPHPGARRLHVAWGFVAALLALGPAMAAPDPLDAYRWRARILLLMASDRADPRLADQLGRLRAVEADVRERQLVVLTALPDGTVHEASGAEVGRLPQGWHEGWRWGEGFQAVLIGKDGGEKARWTAPVDPQAVFADIDRMPMRRSEMGH